MFIARHISRSQFTEVKGFFVNIVVVFSFFWLKSILIRIVGIVGRGGGLSKVELGVGLGGSRGVQAA